MTQYRSDTNALLSTNKTIYEVVKLSDRLTPSGTASDATGRLRVSNPFTIFDSQHRYKMNQKWDTSNTGSSNANTQYIIHQSSVDMHVGTSSTDSVIRETKRVFLYQPGKSLLVMNTFAMANAQANLVQRVGYYGAENGIFLERNEANTCFVLRSNSNGTITETRVAQEDWNKDTFDGTANSYATSAGHGGLDTTKTNIFWTDIEWLGVGDIRCGFVVDGIMVTAHIFHNDNLRTVPYMTTACLPIRYEIFNTGITGNNSTLKQICSTVVSEGGYEADSLTSSVGQPLNALRDLPTANNDFHPVTSIRLTNSRLDAIVVPTSIQMIGVTNNANYKYRLILNPTLENTSWQLSQNETVEYDLSANNVLTGGNGGGTILNEGYFATDTKGGQITIGTKHDFNLQLGRTISGNSDVITIAVATDTPGADVGAIISWNELVGQR